MNTLLLGDRVSPTSVAIRDGVITANFLDRRPDEPMAASPRLARSVAATLAGNELTVVNTIDKDNLLLAGWLAMGHEVRSFRVCDGETEYWLLGESQALEQIAAAYRDATRAAPLYMPVFAVLSGRISTPPVSGFGADYDSALDVSALAHLWPAGHCHSDEIRVHSPRAGALVMSPLHITGTARGTWFFEGDAPVVLLDSAGRTVGSHYISAQGEWMTEAFVPYTGTVEFEAPDNEETGTLILKRDNPTGRAEHDRAVRIPIRFK